MANLSSDVDAIWEEMQQQNRCRDVDIDRLLKRSMATSTNRATNAEKHKSLANASNARRGKAKSDSSASSVPAHQVADGCQATSSLMRKSDGLPFNLQRELNRLADEHPNVRKQAAVALETHFLGPKAKKQGGNQGGSTVAMSHPNVEEDLVPSIIHVEESDFGEMAKPLFKRFNDPVEKVREVCIRLVTTFISKEEDLLRFIPYLMPAITNRVNSQYAYDEENQQFTRDRFLQDAFKRGRIYVEEDQVTRIKPEEPSEEIRLLFLDLLDTLLKNVFHRNASSILHAYMFDILVVLVTGIHDHFHDVNIKACLILRSISNNMVSVMKHFSVAIVRATKDLLLHRLARVRIAAIDTIRALVTCPNRDKCKGSGTEAIADLIGHRDENVIPVSAFYTTEIRLNYFAKLDQDANPVVRKAFFDMVSDWITNLPDRYDHESRLMPYLLSAVSDENDDISQTAMQTLAFLGARYEEEHGEEILEMKQYGVDGKNPSYNYQKRLPPPFLDNRPSLGTRLYVRGRARRFLNPILRELDNWQSKTRGHAVRLLKSIIVYSEESITVDVHVLLQTLLRIWNEPQIADDLEVVAELTGRFAAPDTYMSLILSRIRGDSEVTQVISPAQTAAAMEVLQLLMEGSLDKTLLPHIHDILETVSCKHILDFENGAAKLALGKLVLHLALLLERRGSEAVSAYFLQHGRLTTMARVYDRLFETAVVVSKSQHMHAASWCVNRHHFFRLHLAPISLVDPCFFNAHLSDSARETLDVLIRLESRENTSELFDAHFQKSFGRVGVNLESMSMVQWTPQCSEQLVLEELLQTASVSLLLSPSASPMLENIFRTALVPTVDASLPLGEKGTQTDQKRATERKAVFKSILERLLARMQLSPQKHDHTSDTVQTLQQLLSSSRAAAA